MAKTSMVEREKRRAGIVKKYAAKRAKLKELIRSPKSSPEERAAARSSGELLGLRISSLSFARFAACFFTTRARRFSRSTMLVFAIAYLRKGKLNASSNARP